MKTNARDTKIDLLRCIGTLLVILCHAGPGETINAWRSFDVPLMVMISGASFYLSYHDTDYLHYIIKRFKRLVLPVWVFLTIYIPAEEVMRLKLGKHLIDWKEILSSYALIEGISYVWIFRVFFLMACISPLLLKANKKLGSKKYLLLLFVIYLLYEPLVSFVADKNSVFFEALELIVVYAIGYGLICGVGISMYEMSRIERLGIYTICAALIAAMLYRDGVSVSSIIKFPPRTLYIAGGILVSMLLWRLFDIPIFNMLKNCKVTQWVSKNSMWFYLWHIVPVRMACSGGISFLNNSWVVRYVFIIATAFVFAVVHNLVLKIISKHIGKQLPAWL